jgi:Ca2+-binding RTX toxin-like protein
MGRRLTILLAALAIAGFAAATAAGKVPQGNWPPIDGETWVNQDDVSGTHHGTALNDKLLGGHGDDTIHGLAGSDVIWGDYKGSGNTTTQVDRLGGGAGDDWIYASHGRNTIHAGSGRDTVRVWFGRGFVDCGAGDDILYVSRTQDPKVKRRNCETISHKSARDAG